METSIEELIFPGLIDSPKDDRDIMIEGVAPSNIRYPKAMPAPFTLDWRLQGTNPWCVGFAGASLNQQAKARQKIYTPFDGEWAYKQCKLIDGAPTLQGTYLRAVMAVMKNTGMKPVDGGDPANYKIEEYALLGNNLEEAKIALSLYGGILAAFQLSANGWAGNGNEVKPPKAGERTSGHAVMLTHYDESYIYGIDSLKNYHDGQIFKFKFANYPPMEMRAITCDKRARPAAGVQGWIANDVPGTINGDMITARLNLRETPGGKVIKVLPIGTMFSVIGSQSGNVGGHSWRKIEVI